ncbi:MAG: hypothetical protein KDC70_01165 [Saprospiraceae bacterium]|nr:hypothetical protein [Saprospiraceae bacterium]
MLKQIANLDQNSGNTFKLLTDETGCCGDSITPCKYVAAVPVANSVSAVVVKDRDGNNQTVTFAAAATTVKAIRDALVTAVNSVGYEDDGNVLPGISVETVSTNKVVTIVGELIVVSLTTSGGSVAATATCTEVGICEFYVEWGGGASKVLTVNGVNATLGDLTFATASAANVKSALEGAANWPSGAVATVVKNTDDSIFEITVTNAQSTVAFILDGLRLTRSNCIVDYV